MLNVIQVKTVCQVQDKPLHFTMDILPLLRISYREGLILSFVQELFVEHRLCASHCSRHWGIGDKTKQNSALMELTFSWIETESKQNKLVTYVVC